MNITLRRYKMLCDFERVGEFLRENYKYNEGRFLQPVWEYAHVHPCFDSKKTHRFGVWEEDGEIVGVAAYESEPGEAFLITKIGYEYLKNQMLDYAEKELYKIENSKNKLYIHTYDHETKLKKILEKKGYVKVSQYPLTVYNYQNGFKELVLPDGFKIISLDEENEIKKINEVLWKGFDHGDEVEEDDDCRLLMQSSPHFKRDLTIVIKAPNEDYACFAGMWVDGVNPYAYLEPLATDPKYRKMNLATIALMESMKRTIKYGAKYCYGGSNGFYFKIGFEQIAMNEIYLKEW